MGHKINPLIFRSKVFPYYNNRWNNFFSVSNSILYHSNIKEFIKHKKLNIINVQSYFDKQKCVFNVVLYSKSWYISNKQYINTTFLEFLKKNCSKNFSINFVVLKHPLLSTHFLLKYICVKISSSKISFRKIIPQLVLTISNLYKIKGFKCIISGRINGAQIAKSETFKFHENSSQYKTSYIKYNSCSFPTKYGLLGIKIWLFLN